MRFRDAILRWLLGGTAEVTTLHVRNGDAIVLTSTEPRQALTMTRIAQMHRNADMLQRRLKVPVLVNDGTVVVSVVKASEVKP